MLEAASLAFRPHAFGLAAGAAKALTSSQSTRRGGVEILRQACLGLSLAHGSDPPLVHRDIKPQNILVEENVEVPRICVSDFGLAKHVNPLMLKASTKGTPSFRAPECHDDPQAASCAADVYALGLTIYLMLTDRFPYTGADLDEIKPEHFARPLYPASRINGGVDEGLDALLARALAVDPAERYPHVMALLEDLEAYCGTNETRAERKATAPDTAVEHQARRMFRRSSSAFTLSSGCGGNRFGRSDELLSAVPRQVSGLAESMARGQENVKAEA